MNPLSGLSSAQFNYRIAPANRADNGMPTTVQEWQLEDNTYALRFGQNSSYAQKLRSEQMAQRGSHLSSQAEGRKKLDRYAMGALTRLAAARAEQVAKFMAQPQAGAELVEATVQRLLAALDNPANASRTPLQLLRQWAREQGQSHLANPSWQFLLLHQAQLQAEASRASTMLQAALDEALTALDDEYGSGAENGIDLISAGLNVVAVAAEFSPGAEGAAQFLNAYCAVMLAQPSLGQTLKVLLGRFKQRDFRAALKSMRTALGSDLASTCPSSDPLLLRNLIEDIWQLSVIETAFELCGHLKKRRHFERLNELDWLCSLVDVAMERITQSQQFLALAQQHGYTQAPLKALLLGSARQVLSALPLKIFIRHDDPNALRPEDTRIMMLDALRQAMDQVTAEEDVAQQEQL